MAGDGWTLVKAGTLIDGTGAPPLHHAEILISGSRIAAVGPAGTVGRPPGDAVVEIDLTSSSVLPGLVDAHFHSGYCGHRGMSELEWPASLEYSAVCAGANVTQALRHGYTSALDVGCRGNVAVAVRDAIRDQVIEGPSLRVSGQIISTTGGALDMWPSTFRIEPGSRLASIVSGAGEIRRVIREQAKAGVDNVKLQITRSTVQAASRGRSSTFTPGELRTATRTAHDNGLSCAAHAEGPEGIREAILAEFDTIQHASFIDDGTIDILEGHPDSTIVFTLAVYNAIIERGPAVGYPTEARTRVMDAWGAMIGSVRLAYDRGVPFAVGSDCGGVVHPHGRYARDITLLVKECSLPVEHAVRAATLHAATAAGHKERGAIQAGRIADLVAVRGDIVSHADLLEDPANITLVLQHGRAVRRPEERASAATAAVRPSRDRRRHGGDVAIESHVQGGS